MLAAKEWLREKTQIFAAFVQRFACTATTTRANPYDLSRRDAIYKMQQLDMAIDMAEQDDAPNRKDLAISAATCACRAAILANLADLDADAVQMLMDSVLSRDFVTAAIHLDRIMDSAGFAGGPNVHEENVIRLCEERQRRERVSLD